MSRDEFVQRVVYTHDSGLRIEVQPQIQQVMIPNGEKMEWLGPFKPFDITETCEAIGLYAREHQRGDLLRAADDWLALNSGELPEGKDDKPHREKRHHFKW
jgi:hypothetical protein